MSLPFSSGAIVTFCVCRKYLSHVRLRPGQTQTRLYIYTRWLEALIKEVDGLPKQRGCSADLRFCYSISKNRFSHDAAQFGNTAVHSVNRMFSL